MARKTWYRPKDPDEVRDYGVTWTADIGTAVISASAWESVEGEAVVDANSFTDTTTTVRISGGAAGETCALLNTVTLDTGEIAQLTCYLKIRDR